jgi:hypothetical protein
MDDPKILYLDQNKWIELARSARNPTEHHEARAVLEFIVRKATEGRLLIPLSFTNVYETHKINDPGRRRFLAYVQATLSQGIVFRSIGALLSAQLDDYLCGTFSLPVPQRPDRWFLSKVHLEAVADYDPAVFGREIPERVLEWMRSNPAVALFSFLTNVPERVRRQAVEKYSAGSDDLVARIQQRRALVEGDPISLRSRAYKAALLIEHLDLVFKQARALGLDLTTINDLGCKRAREIVNEVPALDIESQLATKSEHEGRVIVENDLRDVAALTAVLPYADVVIAEKAITNRARQAGLGKKYQAELLTSLAELL